MDLRVVLKTIIMCSFFNNNFRSTNFLKQSSSMRLSSVKF